MSKRKQSLDRSQTETRGSQPAKIFVTAGGTMWGGGGPHYVGECRFPSVVVLGPEWPKRAARWKAEAKRLRKVLKSLWPVIAKYDRLRYDIDDKMRSFERAVMDAAAAKRRKP